MIQAFVIDWTIRVSDLVIYVVVPLSGYMIHQMYRGVKSFLSRFDQVAEVVDMHTEILKETGWARGKDIPMVGAKRQTLNLH